mmetsp:Transcript_28791/g.91938  ORF Transcript_28791/g.91938 Transcript_28791/m.91938 type:complete len:222 (+) Transcript_28791:296-961(+)
MRAAVRDREYGGGKGRGQGRSGVESRGKGGEGRKNEGLGVEDEYLDRGKQPRAQRQHPRRHSIAHEATKELRGEREVDLEVLHLLAERAHGALDLGGYDPFQGSGFARMHACMQRVEASWLTAEAATTPLEASSRGTLASMSRSRSLVLSRRALRVNSITLVWCLSSPISLTHSHTSLRSAALRYSVSMLLTFFSTCSGVSGPDAAGAAAAAGGAEAMVRE